MADRPLLKGPSWAGCLKGASLDAMDSFRLSRELEGMLAADFLWVRGGVLSEKLQQELKSVPWHRYYRILDGGKLAREDSRLPCGRLPQGEWKKLAEILVPELPSPAFPGLKPMRAGLKWAYGRKEKPAALLLTQAQAWWEYVETAPEIRLSVLGFALNDAGQVLVKGSPLPALPGAYFSLEQGVALPSGLEVDPRLSPVTLKRLLEAGDKGIALLQEDGTWSWIADECWRPATRSSVRMSLGEWGNPGPVG